MSGSSVVLAPSVQELEKQGITKVPEQYLQPNQDSILVSNTTSLPQLPVIDLSKLFGEDATELENLDHACKHWGFFQLINHGVNPLLIENIKIGVQKFFNLPIEEKKKFWQTTEEMQGFGQLYAALEEEKLRWGDMFFIKTLPLQRRHRHLIPCIPQPLRDNLESYSLELNKLCVTLIEFMSKALKIKPNELLELFEEGSQSMRMNYYPPCPQPEQVIGLNPHSDPSALTILLQVNEIEGLQVKKDRMWIPIKPLSNAFVINIGNMLEIMTNGIYRSIEHRATINAEKERISIATFNSARLNAILGPAPSLVTPESPAVFNKVGVEDFFKAYFSHNHEGKSHIDVMRMENKG